MFGGLIHYSFPNPSETTTPEKYAQQINELRWCTENCNACSQHWSIECAQFFHMSHNQCFKRWMNWAIKFCLIHHIHLTSPQPTTTTSSSSTFLQGKCFHNQQDTENAFQEFIESWSTDFFFAARINVFLVGKSMLIVMVPILINKDVFVPCYTDLKFEIQNHNYYCTNLVFFSGFFTCLIN